MTSRLFTLHESHWDSYGPARADEIICVGTLQFFRGKHSFILIVWDSKLDRVGQLPQMSTYSKGLQPLLREQNNEWKGGQQSIYCATKKKKLLLCPKILQMEYNRLLTSMGLYSNVEENRTVWCLYPLVRVWIGLN